MKDELVKWLSRWPRMVLVSLLLMAGAALYAGGRYFVTEHLMEDAKQTARIDAQDAKMSELTAAVRTLAEATQNLKDVTKSNRDELHMIRTDTNEQLREVQRLIDRLMARLDKTN